ncbi:MAG: hypothetical protein ACRC4N_08570 [Gammaproteobacteria bacterium]
MVFLGWNSEFYLDEENAKLKNICNQRDYCFNQKQTLTIIKLHFKITLIGNEGKKVAFPQCVCEFVCVCVCVCVCKSVCVQQL